MHMAPTRRSGRALIASALLAVVAVACDRGMPPPSNPLDESRDTATAAPAPTGPAVFPPSPGSPPASGGSPSTATPDPATEAAREKAAGRAIDSIAGWLGVAKTEFTIERVEVVAWPDACLGVTRPDLACAQVITPGERVTLKHRSGETYEVHLGPRDAAAWQPRYAAVRTLVSVDASSGLVRLEPLRRSDEMGSEHRLVSGSVLGGPLRDFKAGDRVEIAVAPWPARNAGAGAIVWLIHVQ